MSIRAQSKRPSPADFQIAVQFAHLDRVMMMVNQGFDVNHLYPVSLAYALSDLSCVQGPAAEILTVAHLLPRA